MRRVVFLDTSVLLNLLAVPRKSSQRDEVVRRFTELRKPEAEVLLVIPIATVVETGNHLAQLQRDERAKPCEKFGELLRAALAGTVPFVLSGAGWDGNFLSQLIEGPTPDRRMDVLCQRGVGAGDASILLEVEHYVDRVDVGSATPREVWTYDRELRTMAHAIGCV
jgi:hypothetical protein